MNIVFVFRIVHALFAIITLYFITQYLTPQEQGWYYTFLSFSALIHLFDFGLSMALVHASAIEFVNKITFESEANKLHRFRKYYNSQII
mgnify:CR=1 FL=1